MPGGDRPAGRLPGALPNLVVVGAMKCGTSSLHYYLDLHPEVAMSSPKELDFFLGSPEPRASDATDPVRVSTTEDLGGFFTVPKVVE